MLEHHGSDRHGRRVRVISDLRPLREPGTAERQRLLDGWFHPYAAAFTDLVDVKLEEHGKVVIVDLHSFPTLPLPYELDPSALRPGVCIGTDPFHTPDELRRMAFHAFADVAGGVAENSPFAGTYVPLMHWGQNFHVSSVMIEIRRDLYQVEPGGPTHQGFDEVVHRLARFLLGVLAA